MQQGGVSGAVLPYYGEVGSMFGSILSGVDAIPGMQQQTVPEWNQATLKSRKEDIKKRLGLQVAGKNFLGEYYTDNTGKKYTQWELDAMATKEQGEAPQNVKSFNEQLPIAKGMSMLFDIQQKEIDSARNTKTKFSDVEYSNASPWPAGFSMQQGGSIPTTQDSLDLYNNAVKVLNFYSNKNGYTA